MRKKFTAALAALTLVGGIAANLVTAGGAEAYTPQSSCIVRSDLTICLLTTYGPGFDPATRLGEESTTLTVSLGGYDPYGDPNEEIDKPNTVHVGQSIYRGKQFKDPDGNAYPGYFNGQGTQVFTKLESPSYENPYGPDFDAPPLFVIAGQARNDVSCNPQFGCTPDRFDYDAVIVGYGDADNNAQPDSFLWVNHFRVGEFEQTQIGVGDNQGNLTGITLGDDVCLLSGAPVELNDLVVPFCDQLDTLDLPLQLPFLPAVPYLAVLP